MRRRFLGHIAAALATLLVALAAALVLAGCVATPASTAPDWFDPAKVPAYDGAPSVEVNDGIPAFEEADRQRGAFEDYAPLDKLGRCGAALACLGLETMPTEPRGEIGNVRPTGWQLDKYDWVDGRYLYNRCHLIGWQLSGENDNERNLITGTRYMNVQGMLPYEGEVAAYIHATGNHVLYRATPVFEGKNLVVSGVLLEAESVEDAGAGVRFCAWCYNVEPGVAIDYATGANEADGTMSAAAADGDATAGKALAGEGDTVGSSAENADGTASAARSHIDVPEEYRVAAEDAAYVLNLNSHKFHLPDCPSVGDMSPRNAFCFGGTREQVIELGYDPCGYCKP